jgi:hypothetical protein
MKVSGFFFRGMGFSLSTLADKQSGHLHSLFKWVTISGSMAFRRVVESFIGVGRYWTETPLKKASFFHTQPGLTLAERASLFFHQPAEADQ